jgi:hypothetical protein
MARKLFNLLKERGAKGEPVHTSLCSDQYLRKHLLILSVTMQWVPLIRFR